MIHFRVYEIVPLIRHCVQGGEKNNAGAAAAAAALAV